MYLIYFYRSVSRNFILNINFIFSSFLFRFSVQNDVNTICFYISVKWNSLLDALTRQYSFSFGIVAIRVDFWSNFKSFLEKKAQ